MSNIHNEYGTLYQNDNGKNKKPIKHHRKFFIYYVNLLSLLFKLTKQLVKIIERKNKNGLKRKPMTSFSVSLEARLSLGLKRGGSLMKHPVFSWPKRSSVRTSSGPGRVSLGPVTGLVSVPGSGLVCSGWGRGLLGGVRGCQWKFWDLLY